MIATITDPAGNLLFAGVCSVRQAEFTEEEIKEFTRLMGEVDTLVTRAARRREARAAEFPADFTPVEPFTAEQLKRFGSSNGA